MFVSVRPYLVCTYICRLSRVPPSFVCSFVGLVFNSFRCYDPLAFFTCTTRFRLFSLYCYSCYCSVPSFVVLVVFLRYLLFYAVSLLWLEPKRPKQKKRQTNSPGNPGLQIERVPSVPVINFGKYFISMSSNASLSVQIILK